MTVTRQVGSERESERVLGASAREAERKKEREERARERDEYNLPFTD